MEIPNSIQYNLTFRNIKLAVAICWEMWEKIIMIDENQAFIIV